MTSKEPIAIIGFDVLFPGDASSPEGFYELLKNGRSALSEVPKDRYNVEAFHHPDQERAGALNSKRSHFLKEDLAAFDAPFFSITPAEAACMDPQQRGLLESTYRAFESSGIPLNQVAGSNTSVYIGCFTREYEGIMAKDPEVDLKYLTTGTGAVMLSNKLSWFYDMHGTSLTLDTACSSSLVACHLACQSLNAGESSMALIGGCNLFYSPDTMTPMANLGFLSPDGICYSFDHRANGYSRGEGFGTVVLKRLSDAVRDKDTIRAVIRNTASNQDGRSPGITQPTKQAQIKLIRRAYEEIGLEMGSTRYFEAHGTGTAVGDPIEASAISEVFSKYRSANDPMYIGALKTNIGHLEGTAGIAGLIKSLFVLERGIIPPNLWFEKPNPKILADEWNFKFPTTATVWPADGPRRASINAFGYGGSNSHVILDDAWHYLESCGLDGTHRTVKRPALDLPVSDGETGHSNGAKETVDGDSLLSEEENTKPLVESQSRNRIFAFSASDVAGIERVIQAYHNYLKGIKKSTKDDEDAFLDNLSYTLAKKRNWFIFRAAFVANTVDSLLTSLEGLIRPGRAGNAPSAAFVFTGQGAQSAGMGRELLAYPIFKRSICEAGVYLKGIGCPWFLLEELLQDDDKTRIDDPEFSQPICTALQVALVELAESWNIKPSAVVGHSSGEIAAAYAAGAISREAAWKLAYHRGHLSSKLSKTTGRASVGMIAVALSPEQAEEIIEDVTKKTTHDSLSVACFNSPGNVTISGAIESIDTLKEILDAEGIFARKLRVENAYHSAYMKPIADEYRRLIADIKHDSIPDGRAGPTFYSSLTGERASAEQLRDPEYWVDNLINPVQFTSAIVRMLDGSSSRPLLLGTVKQQKTADPITELLEMGPRDALRAPLRETLATIPGVGTLGYNSMLMRGSKADKSALGTAVWLYSLGHPVDIHAASIPEEGHTTPQMLVDLPPYPFNHSKRYWSESRISKGYRFRAAPRHELLGAPVPDWNKSNAIWRNWIRVDENPWIKDHRITGSTIYPAAGMLVMAIEASRQVADPARKVKGFKLRDVAFKMALRIPLTTTGIESHFYLRPHRDSTSISSSDWHEFELWSYGGEEWQENCRGLVQTQYKSRHTPVDSGLEERAFEEGCSATVVDAEANCQKGCPENQLYELFKTVGLEFGTAFQNLTNIYTGVDSNATVTATAPDIKKLAPKGFLYPHLIHPTTLDAALQAVIVALTSGGQNMKEVMIPTFVGSLWIAADQKTPIEKLQISAKGNFLGLNQAEATLTAVDPTSRKPLLLAERLVSTAVSKYDVSEQDLSHRHLCFNIDWKPDPSFLAQGNSENAFEVPGALRDVDPTALIADMEFACYVYLKRCAASVKAEELDTRRPHYQRFLAWMQHQIVNYAHGNRMDRGSEMNWQTLALDDAFIAKVESRLLNASPDARLVVEIGRILPQVLKGELDLAQISSYKTLVEEVYRYGTGTELAYSKLTSYIDCLSHKDPGLKILEIGAGTGATTKPILDTLTRHGEEQSGTPRFGRFDFTDISDSFLEKALEDFGAAANRMTFQTLDIERDPLPQGFETGEYDVLIAANVFHVTRNIDWTLQNARKLLKPGGKLLLYELTNTGTLRTGLGFGLLPGWWVGSEPNREWTPLLSEGDWNIHLQRSGFSGVEISLEDSAEPANKLSSVLISTAVEPAATSAFSSALSVATIVDPQSPLQCEVAELLQRDFVAHKIDNEVYAPGHLHTVDLRRRVCIFLADLESSFLANVDEQSFEALKKMTASNKGMLWLTQGGGPSSKTPNAELVSGFARSVRAENGTYKFITLSMNTVKSAAAVREIAMKLFRAIFLGQDSSIVDNTFYESEGVISIPRVVEANGLNEAISAKTSDLKPQLTEFGADPSRCLTLRIASPGLLDTLQFEDDSLHEQPLQEKEVEFRVKAVGLNFLDIMVSLGQVQGTQLGGESAGVVTRVGPKADFKVGDRVCGIVLGSLKTFARASQHQLVHVPPKLSWAIAASVPTVYVTAYCALYDHARIKKGETILIHAAAGGLGQACIQLAQLAGAEVFATVGSIEKRELLQATYGIPPDHIFSSRDLTFEAGVKRVTQGRGVDVIVNSLSGAGLRASWNCIAPYGRFVEVGKVDIFASARLNMDNFKNNVSFRFIDIAAMAKDNGPLLQHCLREVMRLVDEGSVREMQPLQVYPFAKVQEAFRFMQSGTHSGKIVLEPHDDDEVMAIPKRTAAYDFDPNATYVISGGLGGLGRSIARWMASRGAKNMLLLSRHGPVQEAAMELMSDLAAQGVRVEAPPCDVSDYDSLKGVLSGCSARLPQIRGCIQGSMVLKDAMFHNMSHSEYSTSLQPKVRGSWNLHQLLPPSLDFFILLSSASGIVGNRGQTNYNIGNTYQDALARHRATHNLRATSLDLGIILSVGFVAENADLIRTLRQTGFAALRQEEFHALLDEICNPHRPLPKPLTSQITLGLEVPENLRAQGIEDPGWMRDPLFRHLYQIRTRDTAQEGGGDAVGFGQTLGAAGDLDAAVTIVRDGIVWKLAKALSIDVRDVDAKKPPHAHGVDSLVAVELRTWFQRELGAEVAVFDIMGEGSIEVLAGRVAKRSSLVRLEVEEEE